MTYWIENADSALLLSTLPAASVDALVTDPPAGIGFMGKEWDKDKGGRDKWIAWLAGILRECRRLMKPGSYGWVWALPRTSHWTAMACEDAGYTVRDVMTHVQSQGFPKSRALLKPAAEHWILIKAPGELRELRIEENRIEGVPRTTHADGLNHHSDPGFMKGWQDNATTPGASGRWPANFALSHCDDCTDTCVEDCPVRLLDEQSGERRSAGNYPTTYSNSSGYSGGIGKVQGPLYSDSGGASRFFYQAKPSTKERSLGLPDRNTHPTVKSIALMRHLIRLIAAPGSLILDPFTGSGSTAVAAIEEGCRFVGIEQDPQHAETARLRVQHALSRR
jgi:site-specific DNA-methyltransferase (adenine-specific)